MKEIKVMYENIDLELETATFVGDQYTVATFGDNEVMFTVLENLDENTDRPVLMVPAKRVVTVTFNYGDE